MGDNAQIGSPPLVQVLNELKGRITIDVGTPCEWLSEVRYIPDKIKIKADKLQV
jgi:hypothetical protein